MLTFETVYHGNIPNSAVIAQFTFGGEPTQYSTVYSPAPNTYLLTDKFLACGEYGCELGWEASKALWRLSTKQYNFKNVKIKTIEELLQR